MDTNEKTLAIDWSACGVDPVGRTTMIWDEPRRGGPDGSTTADYGRRLRCAFISKGSNVGGDSLPSRAA